MDGTPDFEPCPFCGGPAEVDSIRGYAQYPSGKRGTAVAVYCISDNGACAADMSICREDVPEATTDELLHELAEMWNRRVSPNT